MGGMKTNIMPMKPMIKKIGANYICKLELIPCVKGLGYTPIESFLGYVTELTMWAIAQNLTSKHCFYGVDHLGRLFMASSYSQQDVFIRNDPQENVMHFVGR